ncbi:MAG: multicopper oxidase domain-containing protein [Anaerolineales bacterium]|nr:multicopper oxidase domain-containing protein [Anaerolineales bacterium]MCB0008209.1 multicopper oxidase domain-containing protein [Anaerolineales bacterium]
MSDQDRNVSRRNFLKATGFGVGSLAAAVGLGRLGRTEVVIAQQSEPAEHAHGNPGMMGQVDHEANQFDPHELLTDFDYGEISEENGRTVRTWQILAVDKEIEIAPGIFFPAWVYGSATSAASRRQGLVVGQCPGPTLRCVEGELLRIIFVNGSSHPHTIHFHGIHSAFMDGIPNVGRGVIEPGEQFTYEFVANPFGCHLYHCHAFPLKRHIHKGLYGAFIVDPDPAKYSGADRDLALQRNHQTMATGSINEMVMVMNGFDTNFDGDNEVYAVNSIAFAYGMQRPIVIQREQLQRIYLVNVTEFDPINSLHTHANFFDYYDHGTTLLPTQKTIDTVMQCQAQRGIIEVSFAAFEPGLYMFHAHQSEFAELGWMGFFELEA